MSLRLSFLDRVEFPLIHKAFLEAFADYQVDMSAVTERVLRNRLAKNAVDYGSSAGAFDGDRLVGFTFVGIDSWKGVPAAFDAGSGIIKDYRGKGLAGRMFDFALPKLKEKGVQKFLLEVIQDNEPAIKAYKKAGFRVTREFDCFQWDLAGASLDTRAGSALTVRPVGKEILRDFRGELDWEPSWENSFGAIERIPDEVLLLGAFDNDLPVGLLVYYPLLNWIMTLVVRKDYRRKRVATTLLVNFVSQLKRETKTVKLLNVDRSDAGMLAFLEGAGFRRYISQFELGSDLA
jgi:ribosomal protein S18 acetylase RimI-like enzyme